MNMKPEAAHFDSGLAASLSAAGVFPQQQAKWFAVNTHPACEGKACANLERQGWDTFLPRIAKTIRSGRRIRTELRPFFPGYVFVSLDLARHAWRAVDSTIGVRSIVKNGETPSPLPSGVVEGLMAMSHEDGRLVFTSGMATGDRVMFLTGPFAEMIGSLERMDANGRVLVLLDLLGRVAHVQARVEDLAPAR